LGDMGIEMSVNMSVNESPFSLLKHNCTQERVDSLMLKTFKIGVLLNLPLYDTIGHNGLE